MRSPEKLRFRHSQVIWVAGLIALIGALPLASAGWFLTPVLLVPLAVAVWGWRAGTDADRTGLHLRALVGRRHIRWAEVVELGGDERGRAQARLADGRVAPLPAVRVSDLPRLVAASGREVDGGNGESEARTDGR